MNKMNPPPMTAMTAAELQQRIVLHERRIAETLAPYEPVSATFAWLDTLREIEECINFTTFDWQDEEMERALYELPVIGISSRLERLRATHRILSGQFSDKLANRFVQLVTRGAAIGIALGMHGMGEASSGFATVGSMIGYLMSRRRHFVALLHVLPHLCRGQERVVPLDTFNAFLPTIEMETLSLVGAQQALLVRASAERLGLPDAAGTDYALLDPMFLEPERSRISEMPFTDAGATLLARREELSRDRLFSAAELRNHIVVMEAAYAEFDLPSTEFAVAAAFVRKLSREHVDRDFWIEISPQKLDELSANFGLSPRLRSALVNTGASFSSCLTTYAPLVLVAGSYRSTVTLLSRFMYHWRAVSLDGKKRYQIRMGFIFEEAVAKELADQGFVVHDIKRVNRHEFDVVTVRDGVIWNVQCKNNFLDLERLEADPNRFARYNSRLVRSYERALAKELRREIVLKAKLSLGRIEHMLVSRFPIVTGNPRLLPFSRIVDFSMAADALASENRGYAQ